MKILFLRVKTILLIGIIVAVISLIMPLTFAAKEKTKTRTAVSENQKDAKPSGIKPASEARYLIAIGDRLDIQVYEEEDLSGEFEVKEDGSIPYPLLGEVKAAGLTKKELENKLTEMLAKDYVVKPYVRVTIEKYVQRNVIVLGSVKKPGSYEFPENRSFTILEAVSLAEGFTRYASIAGTKVIRAASGHKKKVIDPDMDGILRGKAKDFELEPGDVIMVPERMF